MSVCVVVVCVVCVCVVCEYVSCVCACVCICVWYWCVCVWCSVGVGVGIVSMCIVHGGNKVCVYDVFVYGMCMCVHDNSGGDDGV